MTIHEKAAPFDADGEENEPLMEYRSPIFRARGWERLKSLLVLGICGGFLLSYMLLLLAYVESWNVRVDADPFKLGLEGIYGDAPLGSHIKVLKKAGFHDAPPNKYKGRPTPENEAAWAELMTVVVVVVVVCSLVGMISITGEENSRLPMGGSAQVRDGNGIVPDKYVVQTSVSHQLHCVKRLRELIWASEQGLAEHWQYGHGSHCIDYLRQALMCHGDLTPIYMMWSEEHGTFMGVQENVMQCRSWEAIVEWSASRNDTGMRVDGDHGKNTKDHGFVKGESGRLR
ncbi:hypothetical protein CPLU01_14571 [Colletotrichum plurivorum]|uniref:Tat pathway signal sequence n=1 Tax=Colletotrichum plurivorum TaxID=2175906 RepID=A0A8H6JID4_9PEZI|nr:hypothetical protein CPLU01_14571 [Colletotrichum plurivorum]